MKCTLSPINTSFNGKTNVKKSTNVEQDKTQKPEAHSRHSRALSRLAAYSMGLLLATGAVDSCSIDEPLTPDKIEVEDTTPDKDKTESPEEETGNKDNIETDNTEKEEDSYVVNYFYDLHGDNYKAKTVSRDEVVEIGEENEIGMNGFLDKTFDQRGSNCYIVAPLIAFAQHDIGSKVIHNTMELHDDGSVELFDESSNVHKTYSKKEIMHADSLAQTSRRYTTGDKDALPIQLLSEELGDDAMHNINHVFSLVTGLKSSAVACVGEDEVKGTLEKLSENPNNVTVCHVLSNTSLNVPCKLINESINLEIDNIYALNTSANAGHALAVVDIKNNEEEKTITIVDPNYGSYKFKMNIDDFAKGIGQCGFKYVDLTPLVEEE